MLALTHSTIPLHATPPTRYPARTHARAGAQRSTYIPTRGVDKPSPAEVVARCQAEGDNVRVAPGQRIDSRPGAYRVVRACVGVCVCVARTSGRALQQKWWCWHARWVPQSFDGGSRGNPGYAGSGAVISEVATGRKVR